MEERISSEIEFKAELFKEIQNLNNIETIKLLKCEKYNFWELREENNFTGKNQ